MRRLTRIPSIDLNDNPFCLDRRRNEERHLIQLNRNPSLMKLTPADQRRSASFTRDPKKLELDLARRKRCLLLSSLRAASVSQRKMRESPGIGDTVVQPGIGCMDADDFFDSKEIAGRRRDVDIDTMADLEPYRREILMQRPTTFGHRPNSASRMFSPSMSNSSGGRKMGLRSRHTKEKGETRRALGLNASMLKELLSSRGVKASTSTTKGGPSDGLVGRQDSPHSNRVKRSVSSDVINPLEMSLSDASASRSSQVRMGNRVTVQSELRRIFSDCPSWDDTPAPTPKTRDVRRGISLLAMPDPNERLRDKLAKSRKLAAGVPVIASSIQEEKSNTQAGRWETPPTTPRTLIAGQELRRLVKTRRKRDEVMASRVQRAEKSVLYNKISPSEELYQQTLAQGMGIKSRGFM